MALRRIRLELARTPDIPERSTVRRLWTSTMDEHRKLAHHYGGNRAFTWASGSSEEPIYRFDKHVFVKREYVSVTEHDGIERPFRMVDIQPIA